MSRATYCDGCGVQVDDPAHVGFMFQLDYCADCKEKAERFVSDVDEAQEAAAKLFEKMINTARQNSGLKENPY